MGNSWFMNKIVNEWHNLSRYVVEVNMTENFKCKLDKVLDEEGSWMWDLCVVSV